MDKVHSYLLDWTTNSVKNRDLLAKKITGIEKGKDGFDLVVRYNDGKEVFFIIKPLISDIDGLLEKIGKDAHFTIITLNNKSNLDALVKSWKKLMGYRLLGIHFINPFSKLDKKWVIFPYTHHRVCDESSLGLGLKSMFEMVEQINEEELKARLG
ncbi:hypothetical protein J4458_03645 [Candidatus Woesearchaeota archaeon]|nr:hypothetical protein [Candidatus Woesearchaeota archaeon]